MKYKLINKVTQEEHLCNKVIIDGFNYYIEDGNVVKPIDFSKYQYQKDTVLFKGMNHMKQGEVYEVIATNNPNIDIPKVVDEVEILADEKINDLFNPHGHGDIDTNSFYKDGFIEGYNKSQETYKWSDEDVVEFAAWAVKMDWRSVSVIYEKTTERLLQLWKEQKPKIIYYE